MKLDIRPTDVRNDANATAPPPRGPVARVIAGSLAAGAVTALVLTLVVFAGGTESVITGSALIAFALGWVLIATLTVRYTDQPQRWALVPAAAMGGAGLALLAFPAQNAAMTRLNWVWPPAVLALVVWTLVMMRRSLTGRGRWLLTPVLAVLALAAVGATYENVALIHDRAAYPAAGTLYDVGGHRLHLNCQGKGGPTVLLFNGLGEVSASWVRITDQVSITTRVCAYDRAGQGWSDDADSSHDGVTAAKELQMLLSVAGEHGPYLLVGHSTGGTYAMTFASRYPEQVAGLVLLDTSSPDQFTAIPSYAGQYAMMHRGMALLPSLTRLGLGRAVPAPNLPAPAADQVRALTATAKSARNVRDELSAIPELFEQAKALTTLQDRPVAVLTASESLGTAGWAAAQDRLTTLSTNHLHWTVDSTHAGLLEDESPSAESARAITEVIASVRTGAPLDTR